MPKFQLSFSHTGKVMDILGWGWAWEGESGRWGRGGGGSGVDGKM